MILPPEFSLSQPTVVPCSQPGTFRGWHGLHPQSSPAPRSQQRPPGARRNKPRNPPPPRRVTHQYIAGQQKNLPPKSRQVHAQTARESALRCYSALLYEPPHAFPVRHWFDLTEHFSQVVLVRSTPGYVQASCDPHQIANKH